LYRSQFDFVIGADLLASCCSENTGNNGVSNNCTVEILLCVLEKLLVVKGKGMIIVSEKSNKSLEFKKFIALIDP
jgi:hypothetical protein